MTLPALTFLQSKKGIFSLLELDQGPELASLLGLDLKLESSQAQLLEIMDILITTHASECSGVVADPIYSFPILTKKKIKTPLLLSLETLREKEDPQVLPQIASNWGVEAVKNNYALAKLELFYNPKEKQAKEKKQLVAELFDHCRHEEVALFLKLTLITPVDVPVDAEAFRDIQLEAVQEFRKSCDLLALQYPGDALSTATLTAELDIPWVVALSELDHDERKKTLRITLENGAEGFIVGKALFSQIEAMRLEDTTPDLAAIKKFFQITSRDHLLELVRIANEKNSQ